MVFNRLCEPDSKLGILRWLDTVSVPGLSSDSVTHHNLLRAMDALDAHADELDSVFSALHSNHFPGTLTTP